jgi:3D (Asp-Asp-Asp) domain-containing protein
MNAERKAGRIFASGAVLIAGVLLMAAREDERTLQVKATAFNSTPAQTDSRPFETACGDWLEEDSKVIAVSRDLKALGLDCGTKVKVSGLEGTWTVADLTARRHEQLIDIYMGTDVRAARRWGVKHVEITWAD